MTPIKERPILFSAPMVRAILEARKTVTRRAVKIQPRSKADIGSYGLGQPFIRNPDVTKPNPECPYGRPGDRLWVRETFTIESNRWADDPYSPPHKDGRPTQRYEDDKWDQPHYKATDAEPKLWYDDRDSPGCRWKPSIHMPRWASRILLEVTDVRVERLQDIGEAQAKAEGIKPSKHVEGWFAYNDTATAFVSAAVAFGELWNSVGGDWDTNPWVWVVEFKRVTP
ncbi:hypothetical protein BFW86_17110 [Pseudomonas fluorescens]|nr:hypothetical protein BFW86_17110 [Pseudomonas fluorescens]